MEANTRPLHEGKHHDGIVQTQMADETTLIRGKGTAHPDQPNARMQPAQSGDDVQQHVDALTWNRAADVQQLEHACHRRDREACRPAHPRQSPASRVYEGCTPFGTTTIRFAGTIAAATSSLRVAALTHRIFRAALIPASSRRPSARSTIEPR